MKSTPDSVLLDARDFARSVLTEVTAPETIGDDAGHRVEDYGAVSLLFETTMPGYPGWKWVVTLTRVEQGDPTVLELGLLPDEDALLAPEWVPWSVRLAQFHTQHAEQSEGDPETENLDDAEAADATTTELSPDDESVENVADDSVERKAAPDEDDRDED